MEDTKDGPFRGLSANPQSLNHDSRTAVCTYDQPDAGHSTGLSRDSAPRARGQSSHSRDFEFVLVTDDQSRRQVRRHAMREHTRQRRLNSIARLETSAPISGWAFRASSNHLQSPSLTIEDAKDGSLACNDITSRGEAPAVDDGTESLPLVSSNRVKREDDSPSPTILRWPCDPHTSPALDGVLDPFDSYPIPIEQADRGLIEHFVVIYPSMMYKIMGSLTSNPMAEIFKQFALHDRLPFQAMLAIASKHRAGVEGKTETVQSLTHKMRALRMMNKCFQEDPRGQRDGTIYAVATMAVIEKWSKDVSIEQIHFKGLLPMIRSRGGMQGMRASSPFLEKVLYWVDFSSAPNAVVGASLPWTGAVPDIPPGSFDFLGSDLCVATPRGQEAPQSIEDPYVGDSELFLRFFHRLRELEDVALSSLRGISGNTCSRTKRFAPGTFLYSILTTLPDYDHGIRDVRFIDDYTGMACLLFLNVALYACHIKCSDFDRYLDWLDMELNRLNAHATPSITSVLWIFLSNGGYPSGDPGDRGERCWLVSRLLRVAKRLQWKRHGTVWDRLRSTLIEFVSTQQECALGSSQVDGDTLLARQQRRQSKRFSWDEDEMREDILEVNCSDSASSRSDIPTFI